MPQMPFAERYLMPTQFSPADQLSMLREWELRASRNVCRFIVTPPAHAYMDPKKLVSIVFETDELSFQSAKEIMHNARAIEQLTQWAVRNTLAIKATIHKPRAQYMTNKAKDLSAILFGRNHGLKTKQATLKALVQNNYTLHSACISKRRQFQRIRLDAREPTAVICETNRFIHPGHVPSKPCAGKLYRALKLQTTVGVRSKVEQEDAVIIDRNMGMVRGQFARWFSRNVPGTVWCPIPEATTLCLLKDGDPDYVNHLFAWRAIDDFEINDSFEAGMITRRRLQEIGIAIH